MALEMIDQRDRNKTWISRSIDELIDIAESGEGRGLFVYKERSGFGQYVIKIFSHHPINQYRTIKPLYVIEGVSRRDLFQTQDPIKAIPVGSG